MFLLKLVLLVRIGLPKNMPFPGTLAGPCDFDVCKGVTDGKASGRHRPEMIMCDVIRVERVPEEGLV